MMMPPISRITKPMLSFIVENRPVRSSGGTLQRTGETTACLAGIVESCYNDIGAYLPLVHFLGETRYTLTSHLVDISFNGLNPEKIICRKSNP
jgi:hypothetical protein